MLRQNRRDSYKDYAVYMDFVKYGITDKVSGNDLDVTIPGARYDLVNGVQTEFAVNTPVITENGIRGVGAYENLCLWSEDLTNGWAIIGSPNVASTSFQATARFENITRAIPTTEGDSYNISFDIKLLSGGHTTGYAFRTLNSVTGNTVNITTVLTTESQRVFMTVLGKAGGGNVLFGFRDDNIADWATVIITNFQVTKSSYPLPYIKTEGTTSVSVTEAGSADYGIWADDISVNFPLLYDALSGSIESGVQQ